MKIWKIVKEGVLIALDNPMGVLALIVVPLVIIGFLVSLVRQIYLYGLPF